MLFNASLIMCFAILEYDSFVSYCYDVVVVIVDDVGCYGGCGRRDGGQVDRVLINFRHVSGLKMFKAMNGIKISETFSDLDMFFE
ncbi:hypothetical protein Hdeb2414_s0008g00279311 [Helianthus debilis subsp. tardiflorus]